MKKIFFLLLAAFIGINYAYAEIDVYIFVGQAANSDITISVDGVKVSNLNGPTKKIQNNEMFKIPFTSVHSCYRKLIFSKEGTTVISVEADFTNSMNLKHTVTKGEVQLDLEDGQTYYLEFKGKSLKDNSLNILPDKKATKILSGDKYKELPSISINNESL